MIKYLLRLFGSGRLPREARQVIDAEHSRLILESMVGSITYRNFRAPGKRSMLRRQWFLGSLAVSEKRMVAYSNGRCLLNLPLADKRIAEVDFSAETPGVLSIVYDASVLHPSQSGEIEIRYQTPQALHVCSTMVSCARRQGVRTSTRGPSR
jgi:hypothetical protein